MLDGGIDYKDACTMDYEEIEEANVALDILIEIQKKPKKAQK